MAYMQMYETELLLRNSASTGDWTESFESKEITGDAHAHPPCNGKTSSAARRPARYAPVSCTTCKNAHKACSGGRPCARCIRLGISDTCVDVTHQKRGRPKKMKDGSGTLKSSRTNVALVNDFAALGEDLQLVPLGPQTPPRAVGPDFNPLSLEHLLNASGWETLMSEIATSSLHANKPFQGPYFGASNLVAHQDDFVNGQYSFARDFELGLVPADAGFGSIEAVHNYPRYIEAPSSPDHLSFNSASPTSSSDSGVDVGDLFALPADRSSGGSVPSPAGDSSLDLPYGGNGIGFEGSRIESLSGHSVPITEDLTIHFDLLDLSSPTAGKVVVSTKEIGSRDIMIFGTQDPPLVPGGTWALLANVDWRRSKNPVVLTTLQSAVGCKSLKAALLSEQDPTARAALYNLMTKSLETTQEQWEKLRAAAFRKVCIVDYVQWPLENQPMCAWGMDAVLFKVNPLLCELLELSPEEIIMKVKFAFNLVAPEDVSACMILHVGAVLSGLDIYESTYAMLGKNGVRIRRRVRTTVARNSSGQYLYSYATSMSTDP